jgi:hypothetical protein
MPAYFFWERFFWAGFAYGDASVGLDPPIGESGSRFPAHSALVLFWRAILLVGNSGPSWSGCDLGLQLGAAKSRLSYTHCRIVFPQRGARNQKCCFFSPKVLIFFRSVYVRLPLLHCVSLPFLLVHGVVPFTLLRVANEMPTLNFLLIKGKKILEY